MGNDYSVLSTNSELEKQIIFFIEVCLLDGTEFLVTREFLPAYCWMITTHSLDFWIYLNVVVSLIQRGERNGGLR